MTTPTTQEVHEYLIGLRDSGVTNMWGAAPYLEAAFDMSRQEAKAALLNWIDNMRKGESK